MIAKLAAMYQPDSASTLEHARELMDCSLELARSQLEVAEGMYATLSLECRELLRSGDSSALLQNWTTALGNASTCAAHGAAAAMQNTLSFQEELAQTMQNRMPEFGPWSERSGEVSANL